MSKKVAVIGEVSVPSNLETVAEVTDDCQFVLAAAPGGYEENLALWKEIEKKAGENTIFMLGSFNCFTGGLAAATNRPDRCVGVRMHVSPKDSSKAVAEISKGFDTSDEAMEAVKTFLNEKGVDTVDAPDLIGGIVARIMDVAVNEAAELIMEGVLPEDIDLALTTACGAEEGLLKVADSYGLDTVVQQSNVLFEEFNDYRYAPNAVLEKLVQVGRTGVKAKKGFFQY